MKDLKIDFLLTQRMIAALKNSRDLPWFLQSFGISSTEAQLVTLWMQEQSREFTRLKLTQMNEVHQEFGSQYLIGPLRNLIPNENLVEFVHDEICLAFEHKAPIFCTETSSYKIVELLRSLGAKSQG